MIQIICLLEYVLKKIFWFFKYFLYAKVKPIKQYENQATSIQLVQNGFIYSEKATNFCEISTLDLSYVVTVKSTVEILPNFVAFSEYKNFKFEAFKDMNCFPSQCLNFPIFSFSRTTAVKLAPIFKSDKRTDLNIPSQY